MNYKQKYQYLQNKELEQSSSSSNKCGSIPLYLINLDRSPHRLSEMNKQCDTHQLSYTRISAVDGKKISIVKQLPVLGIPCNCAFKDTHTDSIYIREQIQLVINPMNQYKFPIIVSPYELGCTLSHYKTHQAIKQSSHDVALVIEDDISFQYIHKWPCSIETILSLAPKDWTIIQLYTNHKQHAHKLYESSELFHNISSEHINNYWGTGCYLINKKGIHYIESQLCKSPNDKVYHIRDEVLADRLVYKQPGAYLFTFPLFIETLFSTNDIVRSVSHSVVHQEMSRYISMVYLSV